jgi:fatty acid desaturase
MKTYLPEEVKAIRTHLRSLLPREAFEATPAKALLLLIHVFVVIASVLAIGRLSSVWLWAGCALVGGHSMAVVAFYGHHLSHGHFVRQRHVRGLLEYIAWTITLQPTTVWRETHNRVHHRNTNTLQDAFRYYTNEERTTARTVYSWLLIPNRTNRLNSLIFAGPTFLHLFHAVAAVFLPNVSERTIITHLGKYEPSDRVRVVVEVALIVAFQVVVFHLSGGTWGRYLWSGLVMMSVASLIGGGYAFSQHSAHELSEHDNPFATTTLRLPLFINRLHLNLAHHTAHHLFDNVNPEYLPAVTDLLREHYPGALDERGIIECWRAIYRNDLYKPCPGRVLKRPESGPPGSDSDQGLQQPAASEMS